MDRTIARAIGAAGILCMMQMTGAEVQVEAAEDTRNGLRPNAYYELYADQPQGLDSYYRNLPLVRLKKKDAQGTLRYCISNSQGTSEGVITESNAEIQFGSEQFEEGKNVLEIWVENDEQEETAYERKEIRIDGTQPTLEVTPSYGWNRWYRDKAALQIRLQDMGSKVHQVRCYVNGSLVLRKAIRMQEQENGKELTVPLEIKGVSKQRRAVQVRVEATDRAGNVAVQEGKLWIDKKKPVIVIEGMTGTRITNESWHGQIQISEENQLQEAVAQLQYCDVQGNVQTRTLNDWTVEDMQAQLYYQAEEEGKYELSVRAKDASGYESVETKTFLIDKQAPKIEVFPELDGHIIEQFQWKEEAQSCVEDFTSVTCEYLLDGRVYRAGERIMEKGAHTFVIRAVDAAGNKAEKKIDFVIDPEAVKEGGDKDKQEEELQSKTGTEETKRTEEKKRKETVSSKAAIAEGPKESSDESKKKGMNDSTASHAVQKKSLTYWVWYCASGVAGAAALLVWLLRRK